MIPFQLRRKSRQADELEFLRFVADEFPGSAYAFYNLAEAYRYYGENENAIENYRKALNLKPDFNNAAKASKKLELPQREYLYDVEPLLPPQLSIKEDSHGEQAQI